MSDNEGRVAVWVIALLCATGTVVLVSCALFTEQGTVPRFATIPGAEYVGMESCAMCHPKVASGFRGAPHAAFTVSKGEQDTPSGEGCESCHGPGSLHVQNPRDKTKILVGDWRQCVSCHLDKKARFSLRYHHPVPEGRMSCTACHDPHRGAKPVFRVEEASETCFECHPDIRGPWTFPHEAVAQDGCTACHNPHGTSVDKMLVADTPALCLRCHFEAARHPSVGGFSHHSGAYFIRGCQNCHRGIHGSNFSDTLRHE